MSATGDNIGLMEGAFFVGRKIILDWINDFLQLNLGRIEETCTGAIACQLCDALYPGKVNMSKVRWDARADFEYVANYKVRIIPSAHPSSFPTFRLFVDFRHLGAITPSCESRPAPLVLPLPTQRKVMA